MARGNFSEEFLNQIEVVSIASKHVPEGYLLPKTKNLGRVTPPRAVAPNMLSHVGVRAGDPCR